MKATFEVAFVFCEFIFVRNLNGQCDKIMTVCRHHFGASELTHFEYFTEFFRRQEFHHTINLWRICIAAAHTTFAPTSRC